MPRPRTLFTALAALAFSLACDPPEGAPAHPVATAPPALTAGPGDAPQPAPEAPTPPQEARRAPATPDPSPALPAVDDACTHDAECVAGASLYRNEAGSCCRGCRGEAETRRSSELRAAACAAINGDDPSGAECPTRRCAAPREIRCEAGHCIFSGASGA